MTVIRKAWSTEAEKVNQKRLFHSLSYASLTHLSLCRCWKKLFHYLSYSVVEENYFCTVCEDYKDLCYLFWNFSYAGVDDLRRAKDGGPLPSARAVSGAVMPDQNVPHHIHTVMLMQWGQFADHDFSLTAISKVSPTVFGEWTFRVWVKGDFFEYCGNLSAKLRVMPTLK